MARKVTLRLKDVEAQIRELEDKVKELRAVAKFIESQEAEPKNKSKSRTERGAIIVAVRECLNSHGPRSSKEIVDYVRAKHPNAKPSSIRSTCSVLARKGEFRREGKKWCVHTESTTESGG